MEEKKESVAPQAIRDSEVYPFFDDTIKKIQSAEFDSQLLENISRSLWEKIDLAVPDAKLTISRREEGNGLIILSWWLLTGSSTIALMFAVIYFNLINADSEWSILFTLLLLALSAAFWSVCLSYFKVPIKEHIISADLKVKNLSARNFEMRYSTSMGEEERGHSGYIDLKRIVEAINYRFKEIEKQDKLNSSSELKKFLSKYTEDSAQTTLPNETNNVPKKPEPPPNRKINAGP